MRSRVLVGLVAALMLSGSVGSAEAHGPVSAGAPGKNSLTQAVQMPGWHLGALLPAARGWAGVVTDGGFVYAIGGYDPAGHGVNEVDMYSPAANTWAAGPSLPTARGGLGAAVDSSGRIYAVAGCSALCGPYVLGTLEIFTPGHGWSAGASLPAALGGVGVATGRDGRIYSFGGFNSNWFVNSAFAYSPSSNTWTTIAPMPTARFAVGTAVGPDGRIYAIGGWNGTSSVDAVEAYAPASNTWTSLAPLPAATNYAAGTLGPDGRIYAVGGCCKGSDLEVPTVDAYSPAANTWTAVSPLIVSCANAGVTTLPDGRLLAAGGYNTQLPTPLVEIYGPSISVSPKSVARGEAVTVKGNGFAGGAAVHVYWGTVGDRHNRRHRHNDRSRCAHAAAELQGAGKRQHGGQRGDRGGWRQPVPGECDGGSESSPAAEVSGAAAEWTSDPRRVETGSDIDCDERAVSSQGGRSLVP